MSVTSIKGLRLKCKTSSTKNQRMVVQSIPVHLTVDALGVLAVDGTVSTSSSVPSFEELGSATAFAEPVDQPYSKRQKVEEDWSQVMPGLIALGLKMEEPISNVCTLCSQVLEKPIRCLDCHRHLTCCQSCEQTLHNGRLHKPEIWEVDRKCFDIGCLFLYVYTFWCIYCRKWEFNMESAY